MQSVNSYTEYQKAVSESTKPVLVKFWADWCGPCRSLKPKLDSLETEYKDKMTFIEVNVEGQDMDKVTSPFGIRGIPAMIILSDDKTKPKDELIGNHPVGTIQEFITKNLGAPVEPTTIVEPARTETNSLSN